MPIPDHVKGRFKLDRSKARAVLVADPVLNNATDAEIDAAVASVNQDAIYDTERNGWSTIIWDRVSPINGVPAQHFLDRDDVDENGNDDIYLLVRDGVVVGFQPHEPETQGLVRIPKGQGKLRGDKQADNIAAESAAVEVQRRVRAHIANKRGLPTV